MQGIRRPWVAVTALFVLSGGCYGVFASRIPAIVEKHGLSSGLLGLLLLLPVAGAILSFPIAGRLSDKRGAAWVAPRLALGVMAGVCCLALAPHVVLLGAALFLFGASQGALDVSMNSWAGEVEKAAGRPILSSFHAMFSLGTGIGAGSGFVAAHYGMSFEVQFFVAAIALMAVTWPLTQINWASKQTVNPAKAPMLSIPRGALLLVGLMAFCSALGEGGMTDWSALLLLEISDASEAQAALGFAVFSAAMVIMRFAGDRFITALGGVNAARCAGVTSALGVALVVLWPGYEPALVGFALMGLGYAVVFPLAFSRAANDPDIPAGAAIASVATLGYGGALLGPPLLGIVAQFTSLRLAFVGLGILAVAIIFLAQGLRGK